MSRKILCIFQNGIKHSFTTARTTRGFYQAGERIIEVESGPTRYDR